MAKKPPNKTIKLDGVEIDLFTEEVFLQLEAATEDAARMAAFQALNYAKVNIQANGQIDTSFLINSGYVKTNDGKNGFTGASGKAKSSNKDGVMGPEVALGDASAAVVFGANYAFWVNLDKDFMLKAIGQTRQDMGGIIKTIQRKEKL